MEKPLVIVITGPTGSGKTALSIRLAKVLECSIISADSRQVFKEIPIGSAAPEKEELNAVKHYFVGSHSIHDTFNAGIFEKEGLSILERTFEENKIQIVCGGTGLYIKALINGLDNLPDSSVALRRLLEIEWESDSDKLKRELLEKDPEYAREVDLNNKQRVIRAIEIVRMSGRTYTSYRSKQTSERTFRSIILSTNTPRDILYSQINERTHKMIAAGWLEEARKVYKYKDANALQTVGFKELFEHFEGKLTLEEAILKIQMNTRRYAKRQLTWIRNQHSVIWVKPDDETDSILKKIKENLA